MTNDMSQIEQEIEATRERLAGTIDQLVYRAHPKTIANRQATAVKATFVDLETGAPRTDNILKVVGGVAGVVAAFVVIRKLSNR
ncbi:membrane protein [Nocardioides phosphati]|uniref:Membrane protein n=1 Tax=Nocardioides phosphati TaxID=1867775 RepID=A0ABQ2NG10_9ACTN|nr:DUF3618 domain-containing protein [Nocardioides phosphati]GGO93336.1 membrane protein [Nocardioides phosphati]